MKNRDTKTKTIIASNSNCLRNATNRRIRLGRGAMTGIRFETQMFQSQTQFKAVQNWNIPLRSSLAPLQPTQSPKDTPVHPKKNVYGRREFLGLGSGLLYLIYSPVCDASRLGPAVDQIWEQVGGGPSDLSFPSEFQGTWKVQSTLIEAQAPFGEELIPDIKVYERAKSELGKTLEYNVKFLKNTRGQIVLDRKYNTAEMLGMYMRDQSALSGRIKWDSEDPNALRVSLPGGMSIFTLVTRRSEQLNLEQMRLETSEYFRNVFDDAGKQQGAKVTGNRCFTKYKWRSDEVAKQSNGPSIVATQVVSQYLTAEEGRELDALRTMGKPIITYTYKLSFKRNQDEAESGVLSGER